MTEREYWTFDAVEYTSVKIKDKFKPERSMTPIGIRNTLIDYNKIYGPWVWTMGEKEEWHIGRLI